MKLKPVLLTPLIAASMIMGCSEPKPAPESSQNKPNILLIVADDMGYSDIASYGGNIHSPVISGLAGQGLSFTNFYVQPTCSPTRTK